MRKQGNCLEKEIIQGTVPGARTRGRPRMGWLNNISTWMNMPFHRLLTETEDRKRWRRLVHGSRMVEDKTRLKKCAERKVEYAVRNIIIVCSRYLFRSI